MEIKFDWDCGNFSLDTVTAKMVDLPGRAIKFEKDAELCMSEGNSMNYKVADIHTGNLDSANALSKEIARRWNEHEDWHECKEDGGDEPADGGFCVLRVQYREEDDTDWDTTYVTSIWSKENGWSEDYLGFLDSYEYYRFTHWKRIRLVEE